MIKFIFIKDEKSKMWVYLYTVKVPERVRFWHENVQLSTNHSSSSKESVAIFGLYTGHIEAKFHYLSVFRRFLEFFLL